MSDTTENQAQSDADMKQKLDAMFQKATEQKTVETATEATKLTLENGVDVLVQGGVTQQKLTDLLHDAIEMDCSDEDDDGNLVPEQVADGPAKSEYKAGDLRYRKEELLSIVTPKTITVDGAFHSRGPRVGFTNMLGALVESLPFTGSRDPINCGFGNVPPHKVVEAEDGVKYYIPVNMSEDKLYQILGATRPTTNEAAVAREKRDARLFKERKKEAAWKEFRKQQWHRDNPGCDETSQPLSYAVADRSNIGRRLIRRIRYALFMVAQWWRNNHRCKLGEVVDKGAR